MSRLTEYEWCVEMTDAEETDTEVDFCETLRDAVDQAGLVDRGEFPDVRISLIRRVFIDDLLRDQEWAYLREDGSLPVYFADARDCEGAKVPQRFHREVAKTIA